MVNAEVKLLELTNGGMFYNINNCLDQVIRAERLDYEFYVDWSESPYRDSELDEKNPWNYYFDQPYDVERELATDTLASIRAIDQEIVSPHTEIEISDGEKMSFLLPPKNREAGYKAIKNRLRLAPDIKDKIDNFVDEEFSSGILGVHLRGPHRDHGGSAYYRRLHETERFIPFKLMFEYVDKKLEEKPVSRIFVASDSEYVINKFISKYGSDKIIAYDAHRVDSGEMHRSSSITKIIKDLQKSIRDGKTSRKLSNLISRIKDTYAAKNMSNYKMGEDVLIEANLLAETSHLIHGCSNVTNFALCKDPQMTSDFIFKQDLEKIYEDFYDWENH